MGEIAEDCYDRALDEMYERDFYSDEEPAVWRPPPRRRDSVVDDFDSLPF
jgi:hypothetical protein